MKLLVIDPNVTSESPSMRAWLQAFPKVRDLFDEVEIWATKCELKGTNIRWVPVPQRVPTSILHSFDFQYRVGGMLEADPPDPSNTIVQATGCIVHKTDIRYIQFWNRALLEEQKKRPVTLKLNWKQRFPTRDAARREKAVITDPNATAWWWVVSRSLAQRIADEGCGGQFRIIPNQFDPKRFHLGLRAQFRDSMRTHHGMAPDEAVFAFSAFGHFERKGLLQAAEAVAILKSRGHRVRLLVLGGKPPVIEAFRHTLARHGIPADGLVFAGMVSEIERHLACADAYFFPSHFEAFSLGEIEAAALGLRLYLTPHYGSEMIMREPINGRMLPWDPAGMADVIGADLASPEFGIPHQQLGEALDPDQYPIRLRELYHEVIRSKSSSAP
jgi:glycosyltransferase involved in cell wall biosynthesis